LAYDLVASANKYHMDIIFNPLYWPSGSQLFHTVLIQLISLFNKLMFISNHKTSVEYFLLNALPVTGLGGI
jgi:hypothetical protein